jgi:FeS assembly protein IscX
MPVYWESTFEIVLGLMQNHPEVDIDSVGVEQLYQWIISLPDFADNPELVNEQILNEILRDWYEEIHSP